MMIKKLAAKEEEVMTLFWQHGDMFIRDLLNYYEDPKPHYNTVATQVKFLEEKKFLGRRPMGNTMNILLPYVNDAPGIRTTGPQLRGHRLSRAAP